MQVKDFHTRVKAAGTDNGLEEGQFEAIVSVFGTEDSVGDVVMPGAFSKTLTDWSERGDPIPVIWSHDWSDPFAHIGHVLHAEETEQGLKVRGQLDLDNSKAHQVYRLLKGRRVTQFSFAFDVEDAGFGERDGHEIFELRELSVYEVGPCLVGAHQSTELLAAKASSVAAEYQKGVTTDLDTIRAAHDTLGRLLADADIETGQQTSEPDDGPEHEGETGQGADDETTDDDPEGKSVADPSVTPAQVLASITIDRLTGGHHAHAG